MPKIALSFEKILKLISKNDFETIQKLLSVLGSRTATPPSLLLQLPALCLIALQCFLFVGPKIILLSRGAGCPFAITTLLF